MSVKVIVPTWQLGAIGKTTMNTVPSVLDDEMANEPCSEKIKAGNLENIFYPEIEFLGEFKAQNVRERRKSKRKFLSRSYDERQGSYDDLIQREEEMAVQVLEEIQNRENREFESYLMSGITIKKEKIDDENETEKNKLLDERRTDQLNEGTVAATVNANAMAKENGSTKRKTFYDFLQDARDSTFSSGLRNPREEQNLIKRSSLMEPVFNDYQPLTNDSAEQSNSYLSTNFQRNTIGEDRNMNENSIAVENLIQSENEEEKTRVIERDSPLIFETVAEEQSSSTNCYGNPTEKSISYGPEPNNYVPNEGYGENSQFLEIKIKTEKIEDPVDSNYTSAAINDAINKSGKDSTYIPTKDACNKNAQDNPEASFEFSTTSNIDSCCNPAEIRNKNQDFQETEDCKPVFMVAMSIEMEQAENAANQTRKSSVTENKNGDGGNACFRNEPIKDYQSDIWDALFPSPEEAISECLDSYMRNSVDNSGDECNPANENSFPFPHPTGDYKTIMSSSVGDCNDFSRSILFEHNSDQENQNEVSNGIENSFKTETGKCEEENFKYSSTIKKELEISSSIDENSYMSFQMTDGGTSQDPKTNSGMDTFGLVTQEQNYREQSPMNGNSKPAIAMDVSVKAENASHPNERIRLLQDRNLLEENMFINNEQISNIQSESWDDFLRDYGSSVQRSESFGGQKNPTQGNSRTEQNSANENSFSVVSPLAASGEYETINFRSVEQSINPSGNGQMEYISEENNQNTIQYASTKTLINTYEDNSDLNIEAHEKYDAISEPENSKDVPSNEFNRRAVATENGGVANEKTSTATENFKNDSLKTWNDFDLLSPHRTSDQSFESYLEQKNPINKNVDNLQNMANRISVSDTSPFEVNEGYEPMNLNSIEQSNIYISNSEHEINISEHEINDRSLEEKRENADCYQYSLFNRAMNYGVSRQKITSQADADNHTSDLTGAQNLHFSMSPIGNGLQNEKITIPASEIFYAPQQAHEITVNSKSPDISPKTSSTFLRTSDTDLIPEVSNHNELEQTVDRNSSAGSKVKNKQQNVTPKSKRNPVFKGKNKSKISNLSDTIFNIYQQRQSSFNPDRNSPNSSDLYSSEYPAFSRNSSLVASSSFDGNTKVYQSDSISTSNTLSLQNAAPIVSSSVLSQSSYQKNFNNTSKTTVQNSNLTQIDSTTNNATTLLQNRRNDQLILSSDFLFVQRPNNHNYVPNGKQISKESKLLYNQHINEKDFVNMCDSSSNLGRNSLFKPHKINLNLTFQSSAHSCDSSSNIKTSIDAVSSPDNSLNESCHILKSLLSEEISVNKHPASLQKTNGREFISSANYQGSTNKKKTNKIRNRKVRNNPNKYTESSNNFLHANFPQTNGVNQLQQICNAEVPSAHFYQSRVFPNSNSCFPQPMYNSYSFEEFSREKHSLNKHFENMKSSDTSSDRDNLTKKLGISLEPNFNYQTPLANTEDSSFNVSSSTPSVISNSLHKINEKNNLFKCTPSGNAIEYPKIMSKMNLKSPKKTITKFKKSEINSFSIPKQKKGSRNTAYVKDTNGSLEFDGKFPQGLNIVKNSTTFSYEKVFKTPRLYLNNNGLSEDRCKTTNQNLLNNLSNPNFSLSNRSDVNQGSFSHSHTHTNESLQPSTLEVDKVKRLVIENNYEKINDDSRSVNEIIDYRSDTRNDVLTSKSSNASCPKVHEDGVSEKSVPDFTFDANTKKVFNQNNPPEPKNSKTPTADFVNNLNYNDLMPLKVNKDINPENNISNSTFNAKVLHNTLSESKNSEVLSTDSAVWDIKMRDEDSTSMKIDDESIAEKSQPQHAAILNTKRQTFVDCNPCNANVSTVPSVDEMDSVTQDPKVTHEDSVSIQTENGIALKKSIPQHQFTVNTQRNRSDNDVSSVDINNNLQSKKSRLSRDGEDFNVVNNVSTSVKTVDDTFSEERTNTIINTKRKYNRCQRKKRISFGKNSGTPAQSLECDFCGKKYTHKAYFKKHVRSHSILKVYMCRVCGDGFTKKADLVAHRIVHDKIHSCCPCSKFYVRESNYLKHLKSHHKLLLYPCRFCDMVFPSKVSRTCHYRKHPTKSRTSSSGRRIKRKLW